MSTYLFDNAAPQAGARFASLETLYDPATIRHLEATNVGAGWRCLEVGGGGGSIAAWLADRVGPTGHVLVTDIDTRFLEALAATAAPNVEVRRHDVAADPLPEQAFDLIHARLVLLHVPARECALARLVRALKPGGWLVIEDYDALLADRGYASDDAEAMALCQKMFDTITHLLAVHGADKTWGRSLYRRLRAHGLVEVGMEGRLAVWPGGSAGLHLQRANIEQIREEAIAAGLIRAGEVERALRLIEDPDFAIGSLTMMSAWGRRPYAAAHRAQPSEPCRPV